MKDLTPIPVFSLILLLSMNCCNYNINGGNDKNTKSIENDVFSQHQNPCSINNFSKSEIEHIVVEIQEPFMVQKIKGCIKSAAGDWPEGIHVLIEIYSDKDKMLFKTLTNDQGIFNLSYLKKGDYCFKVSVMGWQSVVGKIIVSRKAKRNSVITFKMPLGV